jgi:hypothetical protein
LRANAPVLDVLSDLERALIEASAV